MFGEEDEEPSFLQEAARTGNNKPVVENGLFGGNALKDEDQRRPTKSKLNSIFDYEDSDEEQKHQ